MNDLQKHVERLPKHVKIGAYRFSIEQVPSSDPDLGEGNDGITNFDHLRILMHDTLVFQNVVNTLYHELNHAVNHVYGVSDSSCEEDIAAQAANGWLALRIDNSGLDRWMNRAVVLLRKKK